MDVGDQIRAFARAYKDKGKELDIKLMQQLYPDIDARSCYNLLRSNNKHAPPNLSGYPWHLKKLCDIYYTLD